MEPELHGLAGRRGLTHVSPVEMGYQLLLGEIAPAAPEIIQWAIIFRAQRVVMRTFYGAESRVQKAKIRRVLLA